MALKPIINGKATLSKLTESPSSVSPVHAVTVVVVPDIASPCQARHWSDGSSCWLTTRLPKLLDKPYVLEFSYGIPDGNDFSWDQLVHCGDILLERILAASADLEFLRRPLIFISHGLGGVVVKRAVGVLYEQYWELLFERLKGVLSGLIFLGCPHPTSDKPNEWANLSLLLRSSTELSKKIVERNAQQLPAIATVSQRFDEAGVKVPILSAFEGKPTKIGQNFSFAKRQILVHESLARTRAIRETMVRVDAVHSDMCNLPPSGVFSSSLGEFLRVAEKFVSPPSVKLIQQGPRSFAGWTGTASEGPDNGERLQPGLVDTGLATVRSSGMSSFEIIPLKESITGIKQSLNLPAYSFKPHFPCPEFCGREQVIESIRDALRPARRIHTGVGSTGLKTFALCGVGGLGKTQIAVEYAYSSKDDFDAIFILQSSDTAKLAQGFADMAIELGLETPATAGDQIVTKDLVLGWLAAPVRQLQEGTKSADDAGRPEPNWLIIFDNADDLSVLRDFWPVTGNGSILVTSRDPLAKTRTHVSVTNGLDLAPLLPSEGGMLLRKLTNYTKPEDGDLSENICQRLSGLPLALHQIAGTISRRAISFQEFLELYANEALRLDFYKSDLGSNAYALNAKTLWTVWAFEDLTPRALGLLNVISFLDPDQIPEELLNQMTRISGKIDAIPKDYPVESKDFLDARTELSKSSLVRRNIDRKELNIHRIIQDTTRLRMDSDTFKATFESVTHLLHASWPFGEFNHSTARWRVCEPIVPHIGYIHQLFSDSDILKGVPAVWPSLAFLFMDLGWYHIERGNLNQAQPVLEAAEAVCSLAPKECAITAGDVHGCLYYIAIVTNDVQAALLHCKAKVEIFENLDRGGWRLAQAHSESAESFNAAGMYEDAIREAELAIALYAACLEPEYADWAQMNKGRALCSLGRLDEASKVLENYLDHREKEFGVMDTESHKTGQGLLYLGTVRGLQGRPAESLDLYLKALAQYNATVGPKHFRVADVYQKLGATYMKLGQFYEASVMFEKAIQTYGVKPEYTAQVARTLCRLAETQSAMGMSSEAAQSFTLAGDRMRALGNQRGRVIKEEELDDYIPNWSK